MEADYVVLGGGNAKKLKSLPLKLGWVRTPTRFWVDIVYGRRKDLAGG